MGLGGGEVSTTIAWFSLEETELNSAYEEPVMWKTNVESLNFTLSSFCIFTSFSFSLAGFSSWM